MQMLQDKISAAVEAGLMAAEQVAGSILGQRCWVRWPYLQEALVVAVSDRKAKVCHLDFLSTAMCLVTITKPLSLLLLGVDANVYCPACCI